MTEVPNELGYNYSKIFSLIEGWKEEGDSFLLKLRLDTCQARAAFSSLEVGALRRTTAIRNYLVDVKRDNRATQDASS
jgi:hypothetical protein